LLEWILEIEHGGALTVGLAGRSLRAAHADAVALSAAADAVATGPAHAFVVGRAAVERLSVKARSRAIASSVAIALSGARRAHERDATEPVRDTGPRLRSREAQLIACLRAADAVAAKARWTLFISGALTTKRLSAAAGSVTDHHLGALLVGVEPGADWPA
jgi:hypothetical protein